MTLMMMKWMKAWRGLGQMTSRGRRRFITAGVKRTRNITDSGCRRKNVFSAVALKKLFLKNGLCSRVKASGADSRIKKKQPQREVKQTD